MRPPPDADLNLDLDGLDRFADALDNVTAQWNGSDNQIGDVGWLADDGHLGDALDSFTRSWANAATTLNTYSAQLSRMARATVSQFQQTDTDLAGTTPRGRQPITY